MSGQRIVRGDTTFEALAPEERQASTIADCSCPWCSPDGKAATPPLGQVWDTRATDKTGRTWLVHYPELHGLPKLTGGRS